MPSFSVERTYPTVITVRMEECGPGWEQYFLCRTDAHHDNQHCDQELEKKHLDEARKRNAGILDGGDLFCAMQGKWDKRSDTGQLRPELKFSGRPYLDALVEYNAAFYTPYAENFVMLSPGNHETGIIKNHETNLSERLAERLKAAGSPVQLGTYAGWVRFMFTWRKVKQSSYRLRYTHGYGGGGQVTRDLIQANRQLVYIGNADFLMSGHCHDAWNVPIRREYLDGNGKPVMQDVEVIKCGGYKCEYEPGQGWAVEKGHNPKPLGAYFIRFYYNNDKIEYDIQRAK
jgi:hypothetical protein